MGVGRERGWGTRMRSAEAKQTGEIHAAAKGIKSNTAAVWVQYVIKYIHIM